jgi:hypothetical protein
VQHDGTRTGPVLREHCCQPAIADPISTAARLTKGQGTLTTSWIELAMSHEVHQVRPLQCFSP